MEYRKGDLQSPSSVGRGYPRKISSLRKGGKELSDGPSDGADNGLISRKEIKDSK